ncbi:predicted protein [Sclerotinia sclerotiorum 1980 UF-70]|uniref:Uncharacterized protein n=2 Tax=Sclerotinia sclerotiorum (strain ATCC 18683 / 1980 / Ss-1) TaxID=665079 RepID=A7ERJ6_SCLS1|nr:predicted protein [Sclerotinia sclerotiorum 1980 UF-70]APA13442.1 hypothetical protein sscle_11g082120 [Sclerotinia sclerotiorum 1980 UF-70]EDN92088.1 predicted protein [Sclerotinia sclerotiorum 1980 UF-70]
MLDIETNGRNINQSLGIYVLEFITHGTFTVHTQGGVSFETPPCPRLRIRPTSHGSYREAAPQRESPRSPTLAYTAPTNQPETPMRYFDVGGKKCPYYFHHCDDSGMGVWRLDPPHRSSDTTGIRRSETPRPRARDIPYRRPEGTSKFGRYVDGTELRVREWLEDVASQDIPESTSTRDLRASQTARQSDAQNREEGYHWRRDRNQ